MERTSARKNTDIRGRVNSFYVGRESCQGGERRVCRKRHFFVVRSCFPERLRCVRALRAEHRFRVALASAKLCSYSWQLVADELAAAAGEDGRSAGETCAPLLAFAGRRTSESEAVRQHAEKDHGVATAGRLANQDRKQTSARKPSSREVSAARQTGAGNTNRTTTPKGPARLGVDTTGHEG